MKENDAIVDQSSLAEYKVIKKKSLKEQKDVVLKEEYIENFWQKNC